MVRQEIPGQPDVRPPAQFLDEGLGVYDRAERAAVYSVAEVEIFDFPSVEHIVVFMSDGGVEVDERNVLLLGYLPDGFGVPVGHGLSVLTEVLPCGERQQDGISTAQAYFVDVDSEVFSVGEDSLAGAVAREDHFGVFLPGAWQYASETPVGEFGPAVAVVMAKPPSAWFSMLILSQSK